MITPEQFLVMQMLPELRGAHPMRLLDDGPQGPRRPHRPRRPGRHRRATAAVLRRTSDALRAAASRLAPEPAGTCEPSPA